jgi:hypothetical protein
MNRKELIEMIRQEIDAAAIESLKQNHSKQTSEKPAIKAFKPKGLSEDDIDAAIFYGGGQSQNEKDKYVPVTIKEGVDNIPKIMKSEVDDFEKKFREKIPNANIVFDKQANGYSMVLTKRPDGVEATATGIINSGPSGIIKWSFSIMNGATITSSNFLLRQENRTIFEDLYDFYSAWEKEWREKLTASPEVEPTPGTTDGANPPQAMGGKTGAGTGAGMGTAPTV